MIVERIYTPTSKDVLSGLNEARWAEQLNPVALANTIVTSLGSAVPLNYIRIVTCVGMTGLPGAAQTFFGGIARIQEVLAAANNYASLYLPNNAPLVAAQRGFTNAQWNVIMFPGEQLAYFGLFNAGAAGNTMEFSSSGYQVPRANVQFSA
jgi:hypothetical protein